MCRPASFVLTKDAVFWSKTTESHEDIIKEYSLHDDGVRGPNICRVELSPSDGLFYTDPATWELRMDQDVTPEWWDAQDGERRAKASAIHWQAAKVIKPGVQRDAIKDGECVLFSYGDVQAICGGTVQAICGGTVQAIRGGTVQAIWGGTVQAICGGTVQAIMGGTVQAIMGGTVQAIWGGTVQAYVKVDPALLKGKYAVLIDRSGDVPVCYVGKEAPNA